MSDVKKERTGIVLSNKMQKTIVVQVERTTRHAKYGKVMKSFKKLKVHDEKNTAKIGDRVRIIETRPLSKEKRWRLAEILSHGHLKTREVLAGEEIIKAPEAEPRKAETTA